MNTEEEVVDINQIEKISKNFVREGEVDKNNSEDEEINPEDLIPDLPENQATIEFLKKAPKKGLPLPMGIEVKVMQCFRCKATNDRECPMRLCGNINLDTQRQIREDPMSRFVQQKDLERQEKYERVAMLKVLVNEIREQEIERKRLKKGKKSEKEKKKPRKHSS